MFHAVHKVHDAIDPPWHVASYHSHIFAAWTMMRCDPQHGVLLLTTGSFSPAAVAVGPSISPSSASLAGISATTTPRWLRPSCHITVNVCSVE